MRRSARILGPEAVRAFRQHHHPRHVSRAGDRLVVTNPHSDLSKRGLIWAPTYG
jgi:hypothetical protein